MLETLLNLPQLGTVIEAAAVAATYHIPSAKTKPKSSKNRGQSNSNEGEKGKSRFVMLEDRIIPRYMFEKRYRTMIPDRKVWGKTIDLVAHRPLFGLFDMFQYLIRVKIARVQTNRDDVTTY